MEDENLPLVSIIVRSMDLSTLGEALDSLALQTYTNVEVVVVNAQGGTHSAVGKLCGSFPLRLVNQGGKPLARACAANVGMAACQGHYLGFLDDDDVIAPDHLYNLVSLLQKSRDKVVAYAGVQVLRRDDPERKVLVTYADPEVNFSRLIMGNVVPIHAALFPATLLEKGISVDESLDLLEDWDFWLQLSRLVPFKFVDRITASYYSGGGSGIFPHDPHCETVTKSEDAVFAKWNGLLEPSELQEIANFFHQKQSDSAVCLSSVKQQLQELERQLQESEKQLQESEKQLQESEKQLQESEKQLQESENYLRQTEENLQTVSDHCAEVATHGQAQIDEIYNSRSWRVTSIFRWCGRHVRRLQSAHKHSGGLKETVTKVVRVYRREGLEGIRSRVNFLMAKDMADPPSSPVHTLVQHNRNKKHVTPHAESADIIVCVHNALDDVIRCLESLVSQTHPPYHLIVVDDGSGPETKLYLEEFAAGQKCTLIRHETAKGYTCAANVGLRASTEDFVVLLNSDTIVSPCWLDRLIECANSDEKIGLVGPLSNTASWQSVPQLMDDNGDWAVNPLPDGWSVETFANEVARVSPRIYPRVGFLNGFCLLICRKVIQNIGLFDEDTFGRGYGEENDYCLRATSDGWKLAVSDDCYVYHAQSKSYSNERRVELCRIADEGLLSKHGHASIGENLSRTKDHPALRYMRKRCETLVQNLEVRNHAYNRFEGKRVLFLLPVGNAGGGGNIVILEAQMLRQLGVDAWIANLEINRELFERDHPNVNVPVIYLHNPDDLPAVSETFDAVVATLYLTVYWMKPLISLINKPVLGYYIQDFEPDFFDQGSREYGKAFDSYTAIDGLKLFTKTAWNCQIIEKNIGVRPRIIGPSFDVDIHHPQSSMFQQHNVVRVLAMVRPSTPRRAPEITMRVLKRMSRHFGNRIVIEVFGVNAADTAFNLLPRDFNHQILGTLDNEKVSEVLSRTDLFLDCSTFQAMGLTAMEAMAHGVIVIGPISGGLTEIITDGHNGILVNTDDEDAIFTAACKVIEDKKLFNHLKGNALDVLAHSPLLSATEIMNTLFPEKTRRIETGSNDVVGGGNV